MTSKSHNVAIIGYGLSAKVFHIPLIAAVPEFKLYAIVQRSPKANDDAEKDHPGVKGYRSSEEMVNDPEVDVVVVTSTPSSHFELTKMALEHGKHVAVEKPFTHTHQEAEELIAIAKEHQRLITVYQNRRWDSDFLTLSELIKNKTLGRVTEVETHFDRHSPKVSPGREWKTQDIGGTAGYDLGTHMTDQVVTLFGMPKRITAFIGAQREGRSASDEDSCTILLHYEGMMATVKASVISPEVKQLRYWVRGDKGSFKKFYLDVQEDQLKAGKRPGDTGFGVEPEDRHGTLTTIEDGNASSETFPTVKPATYVAFYNGLAKALAGQGELPVKAEEASAVIRLIELARQSSQTRRTLDV
ncbi:MAG: NAD binding Rossmann fold protein [Lasallia pustulata]|uniref:NAD binding Rossmann fold protein n=1 Tax=Lasallia pustulata TaxID=136370 RepID=A0A5M8PR99_9LECA|nr:MAG: NAD binding Rossmann fold protein [Lasallia pustulata]